MSMPVRWTDVARWAPTRTTSDGGSVASAATRAGCGSVRRPPVRTSTSTRTRREPAGVHPGGASDARRPRGRGPAARARPPAAPACRRGPPRWRRHPRRPGRPRRAAARTRRRRRRRPGSPCGGGPGRSRGTRRDGCSPQQHGGRTRRLGGVRRGSVDGRGPRPTGARASVRATDGCQPRASCAARCDLLEPGTTGVERGLRVGDLAGVARGLGRGRGRPRARRSPARAARPPPRRAHASRGWCASTGPGRCRGRRSRRPAAGPRCAGRRARGTLPAASQRSWIRCSADLAAARSVTGQQRLGLGEQRLLDLEVRAELLVGRGRLGVARREERVLRRAEAGPQGVVVGPAGTPGGLPLRHQVAEHARGGAPVGARLQPLGLGRPGSP